MTVFELNQLEVSEEIVAALKDVKAVQVRFEVVLERMENEKLLNTLRSWICVIVRIVFSVSRNYVDFVAAT